MLFPLYFTLERDISSKELTQKQLKQLKTKINETEDLNHEHIYMLILSYKLENEDKTYTIPYNGIINNDTITFDISSFPAKLKQILFKFSTL